jgi:lambda family phage portal protein
MRTSLGRMRMLGGFEDAALVNARVGASKMGFFKDLDATNEDDDDLPMEADPGTLENIGNRELVKWDPQFPDPFIGQFTSSMLRGISSGLNVSYHSLASDLTAVNFSSIRHGTLEEREAWKALQEWFVGAFCVPVFEAWLDYALLSQQITVAGKPLPFTKFDKFKDATFEGRRWQWIDPQAEVLANEVAVTMRSKSLSEVIRETSNRDPEDVWDEIEKEQAELKRRKIEVPLSVKYIDPNREAKNPQKTPPGPNA